MALELRASCEQCGTALAAEAEAYICVYECTYCPSCTESLGHVCRNCGGELVRRPRPPAVRA